MKTSMYILQSHPWVDKSKRLTQIATKIQA